MQENIISPQKGELKIFDLGLAWNWEFDREFIQTINRICGARGISVYLIEHQNIEATLVELENRRISFRVFYDRASDTDEAFIQVVNHVLDSSTRVINPHHFANHAKDKATMHLEFLSKGIHTPYTIILPPHNRKQELELQQFEFERLGKPFIIKPANTTGGGSGVVVGAQMLTEIVESRKIHPDDKYLLQETITPIMLDGNRAWYRVFYALGEIHPCWWDDVTHLYRLLSLDEERRYNLLPIRNIMETIHRVCYLDFFSSEIALTDKGNFVVVDYVNEVCDMRVQSDHTDGVPDSIVQRVAELIVHEVKKHSFAENELHYVPSS